MYPKLPSSAKTLPVHQPHIIFMLSMLTLIPTVTIYEANFQVGGRIISANVYDGAYTFQQVATVAQSF